MAGCGFMISGRDPHPMCIACMGVKHAQAALVDAESCVHCRVMPARILKRRLRVAASSKDDPVLSSVPPSAKGVQPSPLWDLSLWGDIMDMESPEFTLIFDQQLLAEGLYAFYEGSEAFETSVEATGPIMGLVHGLECFNSDPV